jgi:hypothetical protein
VRVAGDGCAGGVLLLDQSIAEVDEKRGDLGPISVGDLRDPPAERVVGVLGDFIDRSTVVGVVSHHLVVIVVGDRRHRR